MKQHLLASALVCLCMSFPAMAGDQPTDDPIAQIAKEAGVSTRMVRMVVGSRTAFSEYRTSYDRVARRVEKAAAKLAAQEQREEERTTYLAIAELAKH